MIRSLFAATKCAIVDRKGVTAAEYAILATGIIIAVGVAITAFAPKLEGMFTTISGKL